jgi:hypothetical protein
MPRVITEDNAMEGYAGLAAIFVRHPGGAPRFIGTGFWITRDGVFVTARHVIDDKIGEDGKDIAHIAAFQWLESPGGMMHISRPLRYTSRHKIFDLAVCTTFQPRGADGQILTGHVQTMTLEIPEVGSPISTHSFHDPQSDTTMEKSAPPHQAELQWTGVFESDPGFETTLELNSRWTAGHVTEHFMEGRDSVMLPSPCIQSDIPVYAGMSGGPVFDQRGRVFAVNCTSFAGTDVAYHVPVGGILYLTVNGFFGEDGPREWTVRELESRDIVAFDPPNSHRRVVLVSCWHIASFRCGAEFVRYRGIADIGQARTHQGSIYEYAP